MIPTVDFHSHLLPDIDDGAKNIKESTGMIDLIKDQSGDISHFVVATPHYKVHDVNARSIASFIERRNNSYEAIENYIDGGNVHLILGAEVAVNRGLLSAENVSELCMGRSDIIMLELPMISYKPWMSEIIEQIRYECKLVPMIAHFDRYAGLYGEEDYEKIFNLPDAIFQFNASALKVHKIRKFIIDAIMYGLPVVMGSDCHDLKFRKPDYHKGLKILKKHLPNDVYEDFRRLSAGIAMEMIGHGIQRN